MVSVACAQWSVFFGDPESNLAVVDRALSAHEADLWVLPELCLTGYDFRDRAELKALAETLDGPSVAALTELARVHGTYLVAGFAERADEAVYNSALLIGPGGLVGRYRKVHLFDREKELFMPGDLGFPVFDLPFGRVGMMICFDWVFPEAARSLALAGADLIAHPANLVLPYCQDALVTRAIENRIFVAMANRTGAEARAAKRRLAFTGRSRIIDPKGQVLAEGPGPKSGDPDGLSVIRAQLDLELARNKWITERNNVLSDRRKNQYHPDVSGAISSKE